MKALLPVLIALLLFGCGTESYSIHYNTDYSLDLIDKNQKLFAQITVNINNSDHMERDFTDGPISHDRVGDMTIHWIDPDYHNFMVDYPQRLSNPSPMAIGITYPIYGYKTTDGFWILKNNQAWDSRMIIGIDRRSGVGHYEAEYMMLNADQIARLHGTVIISEMENAKKK